MDNGLSHHMQKFIAIKRVVLILIVMDNGLSQLPAEAVSQVVDGLNPYCNG